MKIVGISLLVFLMGCALTRPSISIKEYQDDKIKNEIHITGEPGSVEPLTFKSTEWSVSTGAVQEIDQVITELGKYSAYLGGGLIGLGVLSLVLRMWFPVVPVTASVLLIASGAGVMFLPVLFDRYSGYLFIGLGIILYLWVYGFKDNNVKLKEVPLERTK
jgi:hypothetical protein